MNTGEKSESMTAGRQISVFLENERGTLGNLTSMLGEKGINIYALTLTGGIDHGYVRMVVDRHEDALRVLGEAGYLFFEREVLLLELFNQPDSLGRVSRILAERGVDIEYVYCASGPSAEHGLVVVKVDDPRAALRVLQGAEAGGDE